MAIGDNIFDVEINDSEFEREGWKNSRYKGTKLIGSKINQFTPGDITFGKEPVIEQYSTTVYVFNQADNTFGINAGVFYPTTDEFSQTLPDVQVIGASRFKIDRAVTFTVGNPRDFSQTEPGINPTDPSFHYFDTLLKTDLALFNSCSVRFFDNANNAFVKSQYIVGYNKGEFLPSAAYFLDEEITATGVHANLGEDNFDYGLDNDGRLYINPNVEKWFISQTGASGSEGTINDGNTAITIDHLGTSTDVNSAEGYFFQLSRRLGPNSPKKERYYVSFNKGKKGPGTLNQKNILKAFDIHELEDSGSNINLSNNEFKIKTSGRFASTFQSTYDGDRSEQFIIFKENTLNNVVHLDFNLSVEAPAGVGNGGVIIPENLHPAIKESLNVYLGNAGLGAQGGATAQFGLGKAVQSVNTKSSQQQATGRISFQGSSVEETTAGLGRQLASAKQSISSLRSSQIKLDVGLKEAESARSTISKAQEGFVTTEGLGAAVKDQTAGFVTQQNLEQTVQAEVKATFEALDEAQGPQ